MMLRAGALILLVLAIPAAAQTSAQPAVAAAGPPVGQGENGDWADLGRYREADAALGPPRNTPRVVFMGDSITEGWTRQPAFAADPRRVGRGISGQTTLQMIVRFRADVLDLKPQAVHIMAGTNDVAQNTGPETDAEIEGAIASMIELAQAHGIAVVLASIPPAADFNWRPGLNPTPRIETLNAWLKAYGAEKHLIYVDYWPALATADGAMRPEFSSDGVHPNAEGFAAMEPLAKAALARAMLEHPAR